MQAMHNPFPGNTGNVIPLTSVAVGGPSSVRRASYGMNPLT